MDVSFIVRQELLPHLGDVRRRIFSTGNRSPEKVRDPPADEKIVFIQRPFRESAAGKRMVGSGGQIFQGIDQRPVQVKNHKFFHFF